jgi:hypothetical protein
VNNPNIDLKNTCFRNFLNKIGPTLEIIVNKQAGLKLFIVVPVTQVTLKVSFLLETILTCI